MSQALSGKSKTTRTDASTRHRDGGVKQAAQSCLREPKGTRTPRSTAGAQQKLRTEEFVASGQGRSSQNALQRSQGAPVKAVI